MGKKAGYWVLNIDLMANEAADVNVLASIDAKTLTEQAELVVNGVNKELGETKVDAVISMAGGWCGGNAASKDFIKNVELASKQSLWTSAIAANLAATYVKPNGLLILPGAAAAMEGTSGMIGYGCSKASVHQMTKSLAQNNSGLAENVSVFALCPITIDTPMNRKWMSGADFGTWTPREFISEMVLGWMKDVSSRPETGSLVKLVTNDYKTNVTFH